MDAQQAEAAGFKVVRLEDVVESIDYDRKTIYTSDGCCYSFNEYKKVGDKEWTVVKLAEKEYIPFCLTLWEEKRKRVS